MDTGMDMQMQAPAETPVSLEKKKGGKGWMICSIITILLLIGVSVFAVILFVNKDNTNTADLKKQIEEKDAKIATLEENASEEKDCDTEETEKKEEATPAETKPAASGSVDFSNYKIELDKAKSLLNSGEGFVPILIEYTKDNKYLFLITNITEENEDGLMYHAYIGVFYKEAGTNKAWKRLQAGNALPSCSSVSAEDRNIMNQYGYMDDSLGSNYIGCE